MEDLCKENDNTVYIFFSTERLPSLSWNSSLEKKNNPTIDDREIRSVQCVHTVNQIAAMTQAVN